MKMQEVMKIDYGRRPRSTYKHTAPMEQMEAEDTGEMPSADTGTNHTDHVVMDVPLFIRMMEWAREDAKDDVDLHDAATRAIKLNQSVDALTMDDYELLVGETVEEAVSLDGFNNLRNLLKSVEDRQSAHLRVGGEEVELTYPEARFLASRYRAYNRAGRQEEFMQDLEDPAKFDRHMQHLRRLIDKQKAFLTASREQKLDEKAPPDFPKPLYRKLKAQYKDNPERAYATMWMIHNRSKKK